MFQVLHELHLYQELFIVYLKLKCNSVSYILSGKTSCKVWSRKTETESYILTGTGGQRREFPEAGLLICEMKLTVKIIPVSSTCLWWESNNACEHVLWAIKYHYFFNVWFFCSLVYCLRIETHPNAHVIGQRGLVGVDRGDLFLSLLYSEGSESFSLRRRKSVPPLVAQIHCGTVQSFFGTC